MPIYIDINGTWGPADDLVLIDNATWGNDDYETMNEWTDGMVMKFAETHNGMSPTEWETLKTQQGGIQ